MKTLLLGGICSDFSCAKCCKDTMMILSEEDIDRILALDYKKDEFSFLDEDGFVRLRNIEGECFFLKNNKCTIYENRPQGCRFYPIIFDLDYNKAIIDSDCPLKNIISDKTVLSFEKEIRKFVKKIL